MVTPHLPAGTSAQQAVDLQRELLDDLCRAHHIVRPWLWYLTPMAHKFSAHLQAGVTVYDCMDDLSGFLGAPTELLELEKQLLIRADVVFTGGHSLFEAKQHLHRNMHAIPSSVDVAHFAAARSSTLEPPDQRQLPHPRLGYFGVIDERFDIELVAGVASRRPTWQIILVGPVCKVDPSALPRAANIHYLGIKSYGELPQYLAGWDVAMLPFARNAATRFISPTKTPEYLAGGKPVVSTSIRDVVRPYGELGLAAIADAPDAFVDAVEMLMRERGGDRQTRADAFLSTLSWDATWRQMRHHVRAAVTAQRKSVDFVRAQEDHTQPTVGQLDKRAKQTQATL